MPTARPTKLRNGSWGATVPGTAREGQTITIETRSGKTWEARVDRVLWTGKSKYGAGTVSICATSKAAHQPRSRAGGCHECGRHHRYVPCGYPGCTPGYCDECDGAGGLCRGY